MEILFQDIRYAFRMLVKNGGFTAIVLLVMGLSIGAFSSVFGVISAVLIRPLPYEAPDRLVVIWETNLKRDVNRSVVSSGNFIDWRDSAAAARREARVPVLCHSPRVFSYHARASA
jgi:hypothetical protein